MPAPVEVSAAEESASEVPAGGFESSSARTDAIPPGAEQADAPLTSPLLMDRSRSEMPLR